MFDILNNHRVEKLFAGSQSELTVEYPAAGALDMWANNQLPNRALLLVDAIDVSAGAVSIIAQDSSCNVVFDADFATIAIPATNGLYLVDLVDFYRYLKFSVTVTGTSSLGIYLITFEDQRRPVTQSGTAVVPTYGTGRKPKVATS